MKSNTKKLDSVAISQKLGDFFSSTVEETARETKFVRRTSNICGLNFLKVFVLGFLEKPDASLNDMAQSFLDEGVSVTPQGIDERINPSSVAFLKAILSQALERFQARCPLPLSILQQFTAINIVDSSTKSLPENLAEEYPGCGRKGAKAAIKLQLVFEFLHGNLKQLILRNGKQADQGYRGYLQVVESGSLTMLDLGYFCLDAFAAIANKGAYFLSRFLHLTALLDEQGEQLDLVTLLKRQTGDQNDMSVKLGSRPQHALPCRLVILRNPPLVAEKRGDTLSRDYLFILGWTLFVTNAPVSMISVQHIYNLYRIRWQIELIFKLWKSYCGLNPILEWRKERLLTELYAKLIGIVIVHFLLAPLRVPDEIWSGREVSNVRFKKVVGRFAGRIMQNLSNPTALAKLLDVFWCYVQRFSLKQKRRKQPNAYAQLAEMTPAASLA